MPIYEYECDRCRNVFERLESPDAKTRTGCPSCGARRIKRIWSVFSRPAGGAAVGRPACEDLCGSQAASACGGGGCPMREGGFS